MGQFSNYYSYVSKQAEDLINENWEDIKKELESWDVDPYNYFDDAVHNWVDNDFIYVDLRDAADIIESSNNVEYDNGLWEGQEPIEAVKTQAFFTYRGDLMNEVNNILADKLDQLRTDVQLEIDDIQLDIDNAKERIKVLEEKLQDAETDEECDTIEDQISDIEEEIEKFEEEISEKEDMIVYIEETIENC